MIPLKYNTASQEIPLGYFLDSTDGNTEETGLTIANTDIKLWKNGATSLVNKNSGGATHMSNGIYYATLDATDTNTYGPMVVFVHPSGALGVRLECAVMYSGAFDAFYSDSGGKIRANVVEISGDAVAADNLESACDGNTYNIGGGAVVAASVTGAVGSVTGNLGGNVAGSVGSMAAGGITAASIATGAIDADAIAADAVSKIGGGVWDVVLSGHLTSGTTGNALNAAGAAGDPWSTTLPGAYGAGTAGKIIGDNINAPIATVDTVVDNIYSRIGAPAGASIAADLLTIDNFVDELESRLTAARAGYMDNLSGGAVATAAALSTHDGKLDTVDGNVDSILATVNHATYGNSALHTDIADIHTDVADLHTDLATLDAVADNTYAIVNNGTYGNAAIESLVDGVESSLAAGVTVTTNNDKTGYGLSSSERSSIAAAIWSYVVEGSYTALNYMRGFFSILLAKTSGAGTTQLNFRDAGDTKNRVVATRDEARDRTSITLDLD